MAQRVVIVGAGPGGYVAAVRAAQKGAQVTLIEREKVGGTCLNWGCIPSKVMKTTADLLEKLKKPSELGLMVEGSVSPDMQALMKRKRAVIEHQADGIRKLLDYNKIFFTSGNAWIDGPNSLSLDGPGGADRDVFWDRLILAPGTRPQALPGIPFDGDRILSSDHALNLEDIPNSILIVGGGVIGCEFAFILQALGTQVTVVEAMERLLPLPSVDDDCSKTLQREMKKKKITVHLKRTVQEVEERDDKIVATLFPPKTPPGGEQSQGAPTKVEVDKVLICIGRTPNSDGLNLERIGVKTDSSGWILTDDRLATTAPGVYAVGDVLGPSKMMLAHVASAEGSLAAGNATGADCAMDYSVVPSAIFTMPEVATVGLTEQQAQQQDIPMRAETVLFRNLGKAQVIGDIAGQMKIISHEETGKVLGVHMVGPHATDLIAEGALAIRAGCTVRDVAETIHAHPTLAEIMQEGAFKALGKPLHG